MATLTRGALAAMIDHTLLKPQATGAEIDQICGEAMQHGFASVCVSPFRVARAAEALKGSNVTVCTVIGFPLGAARAEVKALETVRAGVDGAREFDMVMNIGAFKDRNYAAVENDIRGVVTAAQGNSVKVILETGLLDDSEIVRACELSVKAGARFVKTASGFLNGGMATTAHVQLMRQTVGKMFGVKASGGIRDFATAVAMIEAGASRLGTSAGIAIVTQGEMASVNETSLY